MKKIVIGILAHVDAGKTTLTESLLYKTGQIKKLGRVDHQDAFLDYDTQERQRGITIFSKQAKMIWKDVEFILVDTPGHSDFSSEMERTLQILDYAILVVSGVDGVQVHTKTISKLLDYYHIPTFIFVNKMDISYRSQDELMNDIQKQLGDRCINFSNLDNVYEDIGMLSEDLMNDYLENEMISHELIQEAIAKEEIWPCFFGSSLKLEGIEDFLDAVSSYVLETSYGNKFKAKVYKITHDKQGNRLTHVKITGGSLKVKEKIGEEKVDSIRFYQGDKFEAIEEAFSGDVVALKGLVNVQAGDVLGEERKMVAPQLISYMNYRMLLPIGEDVFNMYRKLKQISEEDPQLKISYNEASQEIHVKLMGEIQIEILKNMIYERLNVEVDFDQGSIIYLETIQNSVEGVGHFEPLRHYAEVHLLLEPGLPGTGIVIGNRCKTDHLPHNFQNLVLTHIAETNHPGVLTGSDITDIKISLLGGRHHIKHTEGGDFRQATYRAIRQGLKKAKSVLLEPYYQYRLEIPSEYLSRAIYDIENRQGTFSYNEVDGEVVLTGKAPIRLMQNYQNEVVAYTKGKGRLYCSLLGYEPCDDSSVIESFHYDSESDLDRPTGSVFCAHGAGFNVPYDQVEQYMHLPYFITSKKENVLRHHTTKVSSSDEELERIFMNTYGPIKRNFVRPKVIQKEEMKDVKIKPEFILVDGYNLIHAWDLCNELLKDSLDLARSKLLDLLANYVGYKRCMMIVVFDAYKVKGSLGKVEKFGNLYVVYTKEAQTADMYIERTTNELAKNYRISVVTSDALEQIIVTSLGASRISSREFILEYNAFTTNSYEEYLRKQKRNPNNHLFDDLHHYKGE